MNQSSLIKIQAQNLPEIRKRVQDFADAALSDNSKRTYRAAWKDFVFYCNANNIQPAPASPTDVENYLTFCAYGNLKVSTIEIRVDAISKFHAINKLPDPTKDESIKSLMKGIRRRLGVRPNQKKALIREDLRKIVLKFPDNLTGVRNKAIFLVTWICAFRRGEAMSFDFNDLSFYDWGVSALLKESKGDQERAGIEQAIPYINDETIICPIRALKKWLADAKIESGPVFRKVDRWGKVSKERLSSQVVALLVKDAIKSIGLNPAEYSAHSLRAGFITQASLDGEDILSIQKVTRQKSLNTILKYERSAGVKARAVMTRVLTNKQ